MSKPDVTARVLLQAQRFRVEERTQRAADGSLLTRQVIIHPGAVTVVPLLEDDRVCLIRNQRVAVGETLVELPAGTRDRDEPPLATAQRELREETGFVGEKWRQLPGFYMSPGILCERMHVFVAQDLTPGQPDREAGENIDNLIVSWRQAMQMVDSGGIQDAKSIAALLMWDRISAERG